MAELRETTSLLLLLFGGAALLLFPAESTAAARDALTLCLQTVLPSLFPFFVLSSLLVQSPLSRAFRIALAGFMHPLFSVSGAGAGALILGLLGGYPVGARTAAELYAHGEVGRDEAEQLLTFCNNSGPGFFLGVCGASVFASARAGAYLYLIHVCSALMTGMLLRRRISPPSRCVDHTKAVPFDLIAAFPAAIQSSFAAVWSICGFVLFFMVLLRLMMLIPVLEGLPPLPRAALFGLVEMTNGVSALPPTREGFIVCSAIMNWGGLSVQAQTRAMLTDTGLSARRCLTGKAVQTLLGLPLSILAAGQLF